MNICSMKHTYLQIYVDLQARHIKNKLSTHIKKYENITHINHNNIHTKTNIQIIQSIQK